MVKINNDGTTIIMTRGDTLTIDISVVDENGNDYTPQDTDKITFIARKNKNNIIKKQVSSDLVLTLAHEDTIDLSVGKYDYNIRLVTHDAIYDTFIIGVLYIREEVSDDE